MKADDLKPGVTIRGPIFPEPIQVLVVQAVLPDQSVETEIVADLVAAGEPLVEESP